MRTFKVGKVDVEKIKARNIEPIKITEIEDGLGFYLVEVEEDVNIDEIINPEPAPVPKKEKETKKEKEIKKDKKKKKKKK